MIKRSNDENLLQILIKFLDPSAYGAALSSVAIQCMLTLSEDNPVAISELKKQKDCLVNLLDWTSENEKIEATSLRTLSAGLLMNINQSSSETDSLRIACKVLSILAETLSFDFKNQMETLTSAFPNEKHLSRASRKNIRELNQIAAMQQQALEILANLCIDDQESDADSDLDDSDDYEDEEMDVDQVLDKSVNSYSNIPVELIEIIASTDLVKKVWEKTVKIEDNTKKIFEQNPEGIFVLKRLKILRCRAFLCLNNLISSLDVETLGGVDNLYRQV